VMVCGVTDDIQESLSANDVIQAIAKASDGKGGGRKKILKNLLIPFLISYNPSLNL